MQTENNTGVPSSKQAVEAFDIPPIPRSWSTLFRNLPKLITYPLNPFRLSRSQMMLEVSMAMSGPRVRQELQNFVGTERGARLLSSGSDLASILDDHEALRQLPDGSLGRAYLTFVGELEVSAKDACENAGLGGAQSFLEILKLDEFAARLNWPPEAVWFMKRGVLTHDLTHVFTGYGPDNAGEFSNIAYTAGHIRSGLMLPIVFALALFTKPAQGRRAWIRYMWSAYKRGRTQQASLTTLDFESLLPLQMDDVLEKVGIEPFSNAHPEGRIYDDLGWPNVNDTIMTS